MAFVKAQEDYTEEIAEGAGVECSVLAGTDAMLPRADYTTLEECYAAAL